MVKVASERDAGYNYSLTQLRIRFEERKQLKTVALLAGTAQKQKFR